MKKHKKIIILVSGMILLFVLMFMGIVLKIIPNPFVDNRDLVCMADSDNSGDVYSEKQFLIKFNFLGKEKEFITLYKFKSEKSEDLKNVKSEFLEYIDRNSIKKIEEKNNVLKVFIYEQSEKVDGQNKKDVKKFFKELGYECN